MQEKEENTNYIEKSRGMNTTGFQNKKFKFRIENTDNKQIENTCTERVYNYVYKIKKEDLQQKIGNAKSIGNENANTELRMQTEN